MRHWRSVVSNLVLVLAFEKKIAAVAFFYVRQPRASGKMRNWTQIMCS